MTRSCGFAIPPALTWLPFPAINPPPGSWTVSGLASTPKGAVDALDKLILKQRADKDFISLQHSADLLCETYCDRPGLNCMPRDQWPRMAEQINANVDTTATDSDSNWIGYWGPHAWAMLHLAPSVEIFREQLKAIRKMLHVSTPTGCKEAYLLFVELIKTTPLPPKDSGLEAHHVWGFHFHNAVSRYLKNPQITHVQAKRFWGWDKEPE